MSLHKPELLQGHVWAHRNQHIMRLGSEPIPRAGRCRLTRNPKKGEANLATLIPEVVSALDALARLIEAEIPDEDKVRAIGAIYKATQDWLEERHEIAVWD